MPWPDIFFKSRKAKLPAAQDEASKATSKIPSISELKKSVEPSLAKLREDKVAAESLRALRQKDSIRLVPDEPKAPPTSMSPAPLNDSAGTISTVRDSSPDQSAPGTTPFRRRAKLTDFARILLPRNEEAPAKTASPVSPASPSDNPPASVIPAAFPVVGTVGNVMEPEMEKTEKVSLPEDSMPVGLSEAKSVDVMSDMAAPQEKDSPAATDSAPDKVLPPSAPNDEEPVPKPETESALKDTTRVTLPESVLPPPQVLPVSAALEPVKPTGDLREKREFILANGERILGHVLSESADTIYLDHHTLGVLTLPRAEIANKPIEVILINGDRIVGDLIAETTACLYIRHASLGMLTVPHSQRSTRVVEAILKNGDRILGEVLAETDHFTVIRSATLGTVAVQHEQVAMLNRKIEQMQLRALPIPALENAKPESASS